MRILASIVAVVAFAASVRGQAGGFDAVIRQPVEVRGGRSSIFPVTSRLPVGSRVRVIREEGDWVAITPPQGSSSWIMERVLDQPPAPGQQTICGVLADESPVLLGSPDQPSPWPNQVGTVKRGTLVVVLGEKATSDAMGDRTTWWRIQPTAGELRWMTKDGLSAASPIATATAAPTRNNGQPLPELWVRAENAERTGQYAVAALYYRQLATEQSRPGGDYQLANLASARADYLNRRTPTTAARPVTPTAPSGGGAGPWNPNQMMTSGPGVLRRAAFQIDGSTAYALEDDRGFPRLYVIAQPGLNLEPFVNRRVELFGPMVNRQELTIRGYMAVKTLHLLR
jgi:SH3-like domain-containing protein